jgi:hypothetical protein
LGFPFSGIGRKISDLPGDLIARLRILTSGSRVSTLYREKNYKLPTGNQMSQTQIY